MALDRWAEMLRGGLIVPGPEQHGADVPGKRADSPVISVELNAHGAITDIVWAPGMRRTMSAAEINAGLSLALANAVVVAVEEKRLRPVTTPVPPLDGLAIEDLVERARAHAVPRVLHSPDNHVALTFFLGLPTGISCDEEWLERATEASISRAVIDASRHLVSEVEKEISHDNKPDRVRE